MATTGAVFMVQPMLAAGTAAHRKSGGKFFVAPRFVSGVFRSGIDNEINRRETVELPSARVPLGAAYIDGKEVQVFIDVRTWYRFLQALWQDRLGGYGGSSMNDVSSAVQTTQQEVIKAASTTSAVAVQAQANAESLAATRQVLQNAAIPGADQIPPVVTGLEAIP